MAIWQFEVAICPNGDDPDRPQSGSGRLFRRGDEDLIRAIDGTLPRRDSWSEELVLWGEEGGDRIDAALEGGAIAEIIARVDLRRPAGLFLDRLIAIARSFDAHFRTADGLEVPAATGPLADAIRRSDAFRFVGDPSGFFGALPAAR